MKHAQGRRESHIRRVKLESKNQMILEVRNEPVSASSDDRIAYIRATLLPRTAVKF